MCACMHAWMHALAERGAPAWRGLLAHNSSDDVITSAAVQLTLFIFPPPSLPPPPFLPPPQHKHSTSRTRGPSTSCAPCAWELTAS